ncbi:MAG TPA: 30S ribosomal protein S2 [Solirubrobacteraceae bacterium]|nr:30S ribosomal protein S2 [Solirubrobacteraceae bacterium]
MAQVGIRELLEAGVHFGHQTRRWNPKMRRFIHGERSGIYIIDLLKTEALLEQAQRFASDVAHRGGTVLFVGTKKQARDGIKEIAESAGQPYVNHRWLGGLLTNFQTISLRIKRLHDLERYASEGQLALLPTRERLAAEADLEKLQANLGGVKNMQRVPDAMFVVDLKTEAIAVREAQRLRIPIIGLVDTNCDPDGIDYVVPGNDDAIRACTLITRAIGDVVSEGRNQFRAEEEQARREAEEQARREAEERARREAEEQARREAEERAAAEALTQAGEGEPRDVAEGQVAEAVEAAPHRPEGRGAAEAGAAAQAADEPAMPAAGNVGPGRREAIHDPNVGDRVPQEAGAAQGEGAPASDTAADAPAPPPVEPEEQPPASRARQKARASKSRAKKAEEPAAPTAAAEEPAEAPAATTDENQKDEENSK